MHGFGDAAGIGMQCWRGTSEDGDGVQEFETLCRTLRGRSALRCERCRDGATDLYEFEGKEVVGVGGGEEALVAIMGEAVVGAVGVGHVVAAGAGDISTVFLGIERIPARIVYKFAVIADAGIEVAQVAVSDVNVVAVAGVDAASVVAVFARCLACDVAAGVDVAFLQNLCLRLRDRVRIADFNA